MSVKIIKFSLCLFALSLLELFFAAKPVNSATPTCIDDDGNPVDWYIAYKLPHLAGQGAPFNTGFAYAYITSESVKEKDPHFWDDEPESDDNDPDSDDFIESFRGLLLNYIGSSKIHTRKAKLTLKNKVYPKKVPFRGTEGTLYFTVSDKLITDSKSMILRTLALAYDKKRGSALSTIIYNDGAPDNRDEDSTGARSNVLRAHAKGTVVIDDVSGDSLWLTHSCPQFPPPRDMELRFNENCKRAGQTFMCFNFDLNKTGKQIIDHLVNMHPLVYDSYISDKIYELVPEIKDLKLESDSVGKRRKKIEETKLSQEITTRGGVELLLFSKSSDFEDDMYSGWLDDVLGTTLYVETWRNGAGVPLNSSCPKNGFDVRNIQDLKLALDKEKLTWTYRQDHSKWAISDSRDHGIVCISDINRMQSQFKRGGGAVCFKCPSCWDVFNGLIADVEPCPTGHWQSSYHKITATNTLKSGLKRKRQKTKS